MITVKRKEIDSNQIDKLSHETKLSKLTAELLLLRGIDSKEKADEFFSYSPENLASPFEIKNMDKAVSFVNEAVKNNKRILIYGDYDCDGVTSTATLLKYFESINYKVNYYLPDRELEGYGLSETSISNFMSIYNPEVVITVDCGSGNYSQVELLKNKYNVQVLVTDHHEVPEILPNCIVLNPKTSENVLRDIAGVGVAFKLVEALSNRQFALTLLDIVCIGTIADLVPLKGENRLIVKLGLKLLNEDKIKGIVAIKNQIKKFGDLSEGDISFTIAPMINSIGRMDNANKVVDMFLSTDHFYLSTMASKLEKLNNERKFLCDSMFDDAVKMLSNYDFETNKVIVLYSNNWKPGVLGIVASRLVEEYNLPTILFGNSDENIKGSARGVSGIDLYKMLDSQRENLISFGGHYGAAGLTIKRSYFQTLITKLNDYIKSNNLTSKLFPKLVYDVKIDSISKELYYEMQKLSPFGMGNPTPKFLMQNKNKFEVFAKKHLKSVCDGGEIVAFNELENIDNFNNNSVQLLKLNENTFNGISKCQGLVEKNILIGNASESDNYILDYYKQLLHKNRDVLVKSITDYSEILNTIDDLFGTIFVAYSTKTFNNFINIILKLPKYKNKFFMYDICNRSSIVPYNRVVLSPNNRFDFSGYKRIVFIETPLNMVYYNNIQNAYVIEDNFAFTSEVKNCKISKEFLAEVYTYLKQIIIRKERANNTNDLYNIITNAYGLDCSNLDFHLAFYIFYELGFFTINENFSLTLTKVKKPLEQSQIFDTILRIKE